MFRLTACLAILLVPLAACASTRGAESAGHVAFGSRQTLCVDNASVGYGAIIVRTASGQSIRPVSRKPACELVVVPPAGLPLAVTSTGGGLAGPLRATILLQTTDEPCMTWVITTTLGSANSLYPCDWRDR